MTSFLLCESCLTRAKAGLSCAKSADRSPSTSYPARPLNLVVTVKFKGRAGYGVLGELSALFARLRPAFARVKQLAHNKNEVTVMVHSKRRTETSVPK